MTDFARDPASGGLTAPFRLRARDARLEAPLEVSPTTPVSQLVERMARQGASIALVRDSDGALVGIVTEQDVTRRIAFRTAAETPCAAVMSSPVKTLAADERLYRAIVAMRANRLRHMPVVEPSGRIAGILNLGDALAASAGRLLSQFERLSPAESVAAMARARSAQPQAAAELVAGGAHGPEIQAWLADFNNDLHGRIAALCVDEMAEAGLGAPPVPFAVIVMGSGGRGESGLAPDQDNGLVLDDYPDAAHDVVDAWFLEFARRLTDGLAQIGLPYCRGGVMATSPLWRKSLSQWRAQLDYWMRRRNEAALRNADIFFDFRPVWGEAALADELRRHVAETVRQAPGFLAAMARQDDDYEVALGVFRRFAVERADAAHRGEINLKLGAMTPLVDAARLLALREGVAATSTLDRLAALRARDVLRRDEADRLTAGYVDIADMLIRQQIADFQAGRPLSSFVPPDALTARERDRLAEALRAIRGLREIVRFEILGRLF